MSKKSAQKFIRLRGVRHNNLKNFDLDLPMNQLIVVTGLSGSGKSSLAFDTLFAEGQRRYIETFSPYARQFFDRVDKPQVDSIEGIPPAIAIEQRNSVKTTRSTVGTMTEICDYAKVIWANLAQLYCRQCGQAVRKESPQHIWEAIRVTKKDGPEILITFELPISEKLSLQESLALIAKQGYQRLFVDDRMVRIDESLDALKQSQPKSLTVIQDRIKVADENRKRFVEACEQAYHFGKGKLSTWSIEGATPRSPRAFSNRLHCSTCDIDYREPTQAMFSFNHPVGACPTCRGFGRVITIDYNLAVPDRTKILSEVVKPWQTGQGAECNQDLAKFCRKRGISMDAPFDKLSEEVQNWVIEGDRDYGKDAAHQWPRAWYGVKGYFRWLESKAYKMHVRVLLARYRSYQMCPDCKGTRFQPETLLYKLGADPARRITLSQFYQSSIRDAVDFAEAIRHSRKEKKSNDPLSLALHEVCARLNYLQTVGLGYLTIDRPTRTLSGGETERVNLTTCLGSGLVNTLFVLDEPSVGLHPRDTDRLIQIMQRLRDAGNTLVVVEHEPSVMRAADQIIDLGPGHGESGGHLVFQGTYREIIGSKTSLTGEYLSDRKKIEIPSRRSVDSASPRLTIANATRHNLQNITAEIPLARFVAITGVSGSGKTTLVREVLLPALEAKLKSDVGPQNRETNDDSAEEETQEGSTLSAKISGFENLGCFVMVDQAPVGRTPRSNPAVYISAFEDIRDLFALTEAAKQRGMKASAFSFNSGQGQCERCRGAGFEKIEMQFLSDVFIRCPDCNGRRYRPHILDIKISPAKQNPAFRDSNLEWSIADILDATVDDAIAFLEKFEERPAQRAKEKLVLLQEVGLGYLRLGQPVNTLSGGESQRLKLVSHLTEFETLKRKDSDSSHAGKPTLFLFDEPTTGLHFEDVRVLLKVFQRLVDAGHSVVVIEHNLDVIKSADWIIDLGPEAGDTGGKIVAIGTPEFVMQSSQSHTGRALKAVL